MAVARVGIAGWTYAPWRGVFYPKGLPHRAELEYASGRLNSIELNGTFYALQKPASYRTWAASTPDDFVFAVKGGRYITHILRLKNARAAVANLFASGVLTLGPKLGPLLWQLPPNLPFDPDALDAFLGMLPTTTAAARALAAETALEQDRTDYAGSDDRPLRHAVEVRHPSFETDAWRSLLERHHVASVIADTAGKFPRLDWVTADFAYARLHGDTELYVSGYDDEALARWEAWIRRHLDAGRDVYAYFDNDVKVRAPYDAMALIERLRLDRH